MARTRVEDSIAADYCHIFKCDYIPVSTLILELQEVYGYCILEKTKLSSF